MKYGQFPFRRWGVIALVLAPLSPARMAIAQEEELPVFGRRDKIAPFAVTDLGGYLYLWGRMEKDTTKPSSGSKTHSSNSVFREVVGLSARGYVVHPNLLDLNFTGAFGLTQGMFQSEGQNGRSDGYLTDYDISGVFLRKEFAPLTLYSRQTSEVITRDFGSSIDSTTTTNGARWELRSKAVPTRFHLYRTKYDNTSSTGVGDFTMLRDVLEWHSESRPTQNQEILWDYRYQNVRQSSKQGQSTDFTSHEGVFSHALSFGRQPNNHNLNSSLSYFSQSGQSPFNRIHWNEAMRLRHTSNFDTNYNYTFDKNTQETYSQTSHAGGAGFQHRWYKSLFTNGNVRARDTRESGGAVTTEVSADLDFNYRKIVPFGRLSADMGFGTSKQDNTTRKTVTQVTDHPATFTDPSPVVLTGTSIIASSIVITDSAGLSTFTEGIDYTVTVLSSRVEIDRIVGGAIADGDSVLIDYRIAPVESSTIATDRMNFGMRYDIREGWFEGLAVYGRWQDQNQSVTSKGDAGVDPDSYSDLTFGSEYRFWEIILNAEHQAHDSTVRPFDMTRLGARWRRRLSPGSSLGLAGSYTAIDYPGGYNNTKFMQVSGDWTQHLGRGLNMLVTGTWRRDEDDSGRTDGLEQQLELRWRHRQTTVYLLMRNATLMTQSQDNTFQFIQIGIRRDF